MVSMVRYCFKPFKLISMFTVAASRVPVAASEFGSILVTLKSRAVSWRIPCAREVVIILSAGAGGSHKISSKRRHVRWKARGKERELRKGGSMKRA